MRNVGLPLAAAGTNFADIVKLTIYVANYKLEHRAVIGNARAPFFAGGAPPASTLIGVAALAPPESLLRSKRSRLSAELLVNRSGPAED
jgi:enamine deaminase RidA (YjgF/YER057c/UK114 family)